MMTIFFQTKTSVFTKHLCFFVKLSVYCLNLNKYSNARVKISYNKKINQMPDNLKIRQPQDPLQVNIHQEWEVNHWCKTLGTTPDKLKAAVKAVGTKVKDIKEYLRK